MMRCARFFMYITVVLPGIYVYFNCCAYNKHNKQTSNYYIKDTMHIKLLDYLHYDNVELISVLKCSHFKYIIK